MKIEVTDEDGILLKKKFEKFLKKTNLLLEGSRLRKKGFIHWFLSSEVARVVFLEKKIIVEVCINELEKVKKLFEDYTRENPIDVKIELKEGDC